MWLPSIWLDRLLALEAGEMSSLIIFAGDLMAGESALADRWRALVASGSVFASGRVAGVFDNAMEALEDSVGVGGVGKLS